jgi:excisionase family DNA binding protein
MTNLILKNQNELDTIIERAVKNALSGFESKQLELPKSKESVILTRKELSEKLNVSLVSIYKWMKSNKLPYRRIGRRIFFVESEVLDATLPK